MDKNLPPSDSKTSEQASGIGFYFMDDMNKVDIRPIFPGLGNLTFSYGIGFDFIEVYLKKVDNGHILTGRGNLTFRGEVIDEADFTIKPKNPLGQSVWRTANLIAKYKVVDSSPKWINSLIDSVFGRGSRE